MRFVDRAAAGRLLAAEISKLSLKRPVVLALPRGGVPVAYEAARALRAPLDLLLVRKIGVPWQPELAAASIVDGQQPDLVFNEDVMASTGLSRARIEELGQAELREIERRRALYLKDRAPIKVEGRDAILADDGVATGATFKAAIKAVRRRGPSRVIAAIPVGSPDTLDEIRALADDVVCLSAPSAFFAIGVYYDDFHQLTDEEVVDLLKKADAAEKADGGAQTS
jgi:putative phosphoribosyl transferase